MTKKWHGPVAWRNHGNMTPSPPAPDPYTEGAGWYDDADEYPEVDDYGRRYRWEANHSTGKHIRIYEDEPRDA